jgi:hypothetical protein
MTKRAPDKPEAAEKPETPAWFDETIHRITPAGIALAATGDLLGESGAPLNRHAATAAAAAAATAATAATAAKEA